MIAVVMFVYTIHLEGKTNSIQMKNFYLMFWAVDGVFFRYLFYWFWLSRYLTSDLNEKRSLGNRTQGIEW